MRGLLLWACCLVGARADAFHNGLNLPATQQNTNQGNFLPGVFKYDYTSEDIANAKKYGITSLRLGFNVDTALNKTAGAAVLKKLRSYVDALEGVGILCMWDTLRHGQAGHGDGKVNNVTQAAMAWREVAAAFNGSNVRYEIFNEPFGYKTAKEYFEEMKKIYTEAGLPIDRVILDGTGYADSLKELGKLWDGTMAYHFYPNWVPDGQQTQSKYSNRCQGDIDGFSHRLFVTETGSDLSKNNKDYEQYDPSPHDGAVNSLRGLQDCLSAMKQKGKGVLGVYPWHGWYVGLNKRTCFRIVV